MKKTVIVVARKTDDPNDLVEKIVKELRGRKLLINSLPKKKKIILDCGESDLRIEFQFGLERINL